MKELKTLNLTKHDIIELSKNDIVLLNNWYKSNESYIKKNIDEIKTPFDCVAIYFLGNIVFKDGDRYSGYAFEKNVGKLASLIYNIINLDFERNKINMLYKKPIECEFLYSEEKYKLLSKPDIIKAMNMERDYACQDMFVVLALFSYLSLNKDSVLKEVKTHSEKILSKKDKRAGKKPKVKLTKQTIIKLDTSKLEALTEEEKIHYERHTFGWTVRGHWREYKSGKKVWIKPQVRGDKDKVKGKIYEV